MKCLLGHFRTATNARWRWSFPVRSSKLIELNKSKRHELRYPGNDGHNAFMSKRAGESKSRNGKIKPMADAPGKREVTKKTPGIIMDKPAAPVMVTTAKPQTVQPEVRLGSTVQPPRVHAPAPVRDPEPPAQETNPPSPPQPPLLFEIAWEVCWQLGGIYTVLRTKADAMRDQWDERYCLIGPYNPATAALEFEERPTEGIIRETLDRLRAAGIPCHYGTWLVPGRPRVILLDYRARYGRVHEDKYLLWADHT